MKKLKKIILPIFLIIINILFISIPVNALEIPVRVLTDTTPIVIDNTININPQFIDNTNTSTKSFGIGGTVINTLPKDVNIVSTTTYYDQNNNVITTSTITQLLPAETTVEYTNMTDLYKVPTNISVQDIKYYSMNIEVQETKDENYTPSLIEKYQYYDYLIDAYDINIKVNENNTFDITEKITANFLAKNKHGIFRKLPTKNTVERLNGTTSKNRAQITNVEVSNEYTTSREGHYLVLKIGNPSLTISGKQEYNISYNYNIGKDKVKDYDEFYFNLIGPEWDTAIGNITFTIEMPKEFDSSKLGFSSGIVGSTDSSNIIYTVNGNKIEGYYKGILNTYEALTVRLELDEGYFVGAGYTLTFDSKDLIKVLAPLLLVIIGFTTWIIYGKDRQAVDSVEFYPPEGFNSLDVALALKGEIDSYDVTSLLIYLANKGYIKISETESRSYFSNKGFKITKVKDYDGNNINEQLFLDGLFRYKRVTNSPASQALELDNITSVTDMDLYNKFYETTIRIKKNMNTNENKYKIFEKNSLNKRTLIIILIILTFCIITIPPCLIYTDIGLTIATLVFASGGFSMSLSALAGLSSTVFYLNGKKYESKILSATIEIVFGLICSSTLFFPVLLPALLNDFVYFFGYIIGLICVFFLFTIMKYMPKRTKEGTMIYGKIKGFKKFLETSKKAQLESMVMQNPKYFYDILPYTYVLGISDKWIKKFETINLQAPNWYDSSTPFNAMAFGSFISNTMNSAHSSMASSPSSSSDGSSGRSSGGGSSGGGSGGGGGGSW